ncbi:MAG TPA: flagellar motor switch protein FliM [Clostridiales bacterium]|nr:flagellar motor switch protein FliM [Clostridiales bacterium]
MGDILSQNEIDELLKALGTGELNVKDIKDASGEKKIINYNFKRPSKFSKDHLKALKSIYENYARLATNFLTGYLRALVQIDVIESESLTYSEFIGSISNPLVLAVVDFTPLEGSIIIEIPPKIVFAFIDRILGGKCNTFEDEREFTEIELAIIERIVVQMLNVMREPWQNIIQIRPILEKIETNTQFARIISPNEVVALVTLSIKLSDVEGMINICIPYITVEPIIEKLSTRYWFTSIERQTDSSSKELIESKISATKVPLKAIFGSTSITVSDFIELQKGDVLPLDNDINSELDVYVGNLLKFRGKPGVKKNRVSIKITALVGKEDE